MFWFLFTTLVAAHPVTFTNGTAVSSINRPKMTHTQINYTVARNFAVAGSYVRLDLDSQAVAAPIVHANVLIKRWNRIGSQANVYGIVGLGYNLENEVLTSSVSDVASRGFGYSSLQADYETQRIYTALSGFSMFNTEILAYGGRYRFGVAPYIADYNELQVWVVGQLDYLSDMQEQPYVTPMLRFFYRTVLWETGVSLSGTYWFQMMAHF